MSLIVSAPEGGSKWPLLEAGTYPAVCIGIIDIGEHDNPMYATSARKVIIMWEMPGETMEIDGKEESRVMSETYTASLGDKANLRKMLDGWRGRPFSPEELKGFDLRSILGVPCLLGTVVKEKANGQGQFAKISTVSKLPKGFQVPQPRNVPSSFDLDAPTALQDMEALPKWVQDRIKESITYQSMPQNMVDASGEQNPFNVTEEEVFATAFGNGY